MATKAPTRPQQRHSSQQRDSSSRQSRTWQNLTDRRKLRHIESTLDKAITQALQEGGVGSHEEFKAYVESCSEDRSRLPSLLSSVRVVAMMMKFEATASISPATLAKELAASI
ncbi:MULTISPECIES: hypothetical protein [Trichocoleus]|uniref:Uncharacterized protein n=1 Tax=Trichocoleus desertorum GB2-A4 TaxID=2933944 RepID=A0ABV0JG18_9CYAN|nr:hypothetical protein [Trichocoleus sp. FACHB-46]MBD1864800.1 hypothetical protein [Trichocoleus sp. FACHB-46]